eukprot:3508243-Pleurochrysis_carterae.AAC.3
MPINGKLTPFQPALYRSLAHPQHRPTSQCGQGQPSEKQFELCTVTCNARSTRAAKSGIGAVDTYPAMTATTAPCPSLPPTRQAFLGNRGHTRTFWRGERRHQARIRTLDVHPLPSRQINT